MIQSILFPKDEFTLLESYDWLRKNGYKNNKVDITENFFRFRQMNPMEGGRYITKTLKNGIELVIHIK
jgi:hypothetical protein